MGENAIGVDEQRLQQLLGKMVGEIGAVATAPLVALGDRLGLYKAMAARGPVDAAELAEATGTHERYVREWLCAQAAAGYVDYDAAAQRFVLTPEQAEVFARDDSPANMQGAFEIMAAMFHDAARMEGAFRSGEGIGWHEHHRCLFSGTERFFRAGYNANLVPSWLPALDGVVDKLQRGAKVADVGCGHGASTIVMAQAFPNSRFTGYDYHPASVEVASLRARDAGLGDRVAFKRAGAKDFPGEDYDLVAFFDCLHDMGDPAGAAAHVRETLAADGTWMIVEPFAHDAVADNFNPVGRVFYAASTMICVPCSRSQEVKLGLGAQAGERRIREVVAGAGFQRFRRAAETPFNLVLEARP